MVSYEALLERVKQTGGVYCLGLAKGEHSRLKERTEGTQQVEEQGDGRTPFHKQLLSMSMEESHRNQSED